MKRAGFVLTSLVLLLVTLVPFAARAQGPVHIAHTPPSFAAPGQQIDLLAVLTNASSAVVVWNNGSLAKAATVPMTNLSRAQGDAWVYEAWLPAQPDGALVEYAITATGPAGPTTQSYTVPVLAPSTTNVTPETEQAWLLTLAAAMSITVSTIVAIYYYVGLRLRREPE